MINMSLIRKLRDNFPCKIPSRTKIQQEGSHLAKIQHFQSLINFCDMFVLFLYFKLQYCNIIAKQSKLYICKFIDITLISNPIIKNLMEQQQNESLISDPYSDYVMDYTGRGQKFNNSSCKVYRCQYCIKFRNHSKSRAKMHKKACFKRQRIMINKKNEEEAKKLLQEQLNRNLSQIQIRHNQNNLELDNFELKTLKNKISSIEQQILSMKNSKQLRVGQISNFCWNFTEQVFQKIQKGIITTMKIKLSSAIEQAIQGGIQISKMKNIICNNIMLKVNQITYHDIIFDFNQKLTEAHKDLQKQCLKSISKNHPTSRTFDNNQRAYKFFIKYQEFNFYYQAKLISDMLTLTKWQRQDFRRYYMLLKQKSLYFSRFPSMPKFQGESTKKIRPLVSMQKVKKQVAQLFMKNKKVLATDIWAVVCLGLRRPQLLRVQFRCQNGSIAKSIRIVQNKNKNLAMRYIPESLAQLIKFSQATYPMTKQRLKITRDHCLSKLQTFYGCRHLCITSVLSSLSASTQYAKFHRSITTTQKYYLNSMDQQFLNTAFNLVINKPANYMKQERSIILDLDQEVIQEITDQQVQITIQQMQQIMDSYQDDALITRQLSIQNIQNDKQIESNQKLSLISKVYAFNKYQIQLQDQNKNSLPAVLSKISSKQFTQTVFQNLARQGLPISTNNILRSTHQVSGFNINFVQINKVGDLKKQFHIQKVISQSEDTIYIAKNQDLFSYSDNLITKRKLQQKISKKSKYQNGINQKYDQKLLNQNPSCKACKQGYMWSTVIHKKTAIICDNCKVYETETSQINLNTYISCQSMKIKCQTKIVLSQNHKSLKRINKKNNIQQIIVQQFGNDAYSNKNWYSSDIDLNLFTNYCAFSSKLSKQIQYNRQNELFLPLVIKQSQIPGAGYGLYPTQDVSKNTIILTYLGVISSGFSVDIKNDSLYSLGWLQGSKNKIPRQLIIFPKLKTNGGRYINGCFKLTQRPNCEIRIGILNNNQILVYIVTKQYVERNKQFLYQYGDNFSKSIQQSSMESQNDDAEE